ncbi:DUF6404 family protein [Xenorhabdus littoralis]
MPYLTILLWKLGVKIPPTTFAKFWFDIVIYALFGGII